MINLKLDPDGKGSDNEKGNSFYGEKHELLRSTITVRNPKCQLLNLDVVFLDRL